VENLSIYQTIPIVHIMRNCVNTVEINSWKTEIVDFFRHYSSSIADDTFITLYGSVRNFVFAKKNKYEKVDVPAG